MRPLNDFLRKNKELDWLDPTTVVLGAFNKSKFISVEPLVLALQKALKLYMTDTNAAAFESRALLLQLQNGSSLNEWATIGCCS